MWPLAWHAHRSRFTHTLYRSVNQQWQQSCYNATKGRHLYEIQSNVDRSRSMGAKRKEQVIIRRLRIGHSNLNSTLWIIGKHPTGMCEQCQEAETVEHVLTKCKNVLRKVKK